MNRQAAIGFLMAIFCWGCSGVQVTQDYDPATDFNMLKAFHWASATQEKTGDPRIDNPLRDSRIREAVTRVLKEKGFEMTDAGTPGFAVVYRTTIRQKLESSGTGIGFGIGSFGRHGGIGIGTGTGNNLREVDEAALTIDFLTGSGDLLWRGTGTSRLVEYDDPQKAVSDINVLVEKILAQFPPQG